MTTDIKEIADAFNSRAATYARSDWHQRCAERLVELCPVSPGARVLDAGTGTGFAALAAARRVGPGGSVLGVDVSPGMLREASAAVNASGLSNVELLEANVLHLPQYPSETFDVVTCSTGLLYMPVAEALREWRRLLKPGGLVAFSALQSGSPAGRRIFRACAAGFGLVLPDPWEPLGTIAACRTALAKAGFEVAEIVNEVVEFSAQDLSVAWESNFKSPGHREARLLNVEDQAALKNAYLDALAREERQNPGALTRADILYALGRR
jgi:ubiquinone/menaquinone biosynthesis C-methylase UbiE